MYPIMYKHVHYSMGLKQPKSAHILWNWLNKFYGSLYY